MDTKSAVSLKPLPPPLTYTREIVGLVAEAGNAIAVLNGAASLFKHHEVMTLPSIMREAVASVRIEGTMTTFDEVAEYSVQPSLFEHDPNREEAWNYRSALLSGCELLKTLPLCNRLLKEVHSILLKGVRGKEKSPGQFRDQQVGIKYDGEIIYSPPSAKEVPDLMGELENYIANLEVDGEAELIRCALIHYQFEAIHPFADGNGRTGRLLIFLYMYSKGVLKYPILNLSQFFEKNRSEYLAGLRAVSEEGDWNSWLAFFLRSVAEQARYKYLKLLELHELYSEIRDILRKSKSPVSSLDTLDIVFRSLFVSARDITKNLSVSSPTSYSVIKRLIGLGVLKEAYEAKPAVYICERLMNYWRSV